MADRRYDVLTLGETMWRMSAPSQMRLEQVTSLNVHVGGSESNTAAALSRLGKRTAWWSRLPDNPLGHHVAAALRAHGVDVDHVLYAGARLGTYFVEYGSPPRPSQIVYDRAGSSASQMHPAEFPLSLLDQTRWLHLTGITPGLSSTCLDTVQHVLSEARARSIPVSFDINYRSRLWSWEQARPVIASLAPHCTLLIAAERDALQILQHTQSASDLAFALRDRWNIPTVVITRSEHGAVGLDSNGLVEVQAFSVQVVERIGAGDAFDAGLISGQLDGLSLADSLRLGCAAAALKLTIPGDIALISKSDVDQVLANAAAIIQR